MKKVYFLIIIISCLLVFITTSTTAQVKIGANPKVIARGSILELEHPNKALLLTRVANVGEVVNPVDGMIVYDIEMGCVRSFQRGAWSSCFAICDEDPEPPVAVLDCGTAVFTPYIASASGPYNGTLEVSYTGGNGVAYATQSIPSIEVLGLTAKLLQGVLNTGDGVLNFTVSGIPSAVGIAKFPFSFGGSACILELEVREDVTTQTEYVLTANPTTLTFESVGGVQTVAVTAKRVVKTYIGGVYQSGMDQESSADFEVVGITGDGFSQQVDGATINVTAETNSGSQRTGTVTLRLVDNPATTAIISLNQSEVVPTYEYTYTLTVDPQNLSFISTGESKSFAVTAQKTTKTYINGELTNTTTAATSWSSSVVGAGFSVNNNVVTATNNTTASQRNGTVTVQIDEHPTTTATVSLTQAAGTSTTSVSYALTVNPQNLSFISTGESKSFAVTAQKITKTYVNGVLTNTATVNVPWSSSVVGTGFSINNNVVTATNNTTTSQRNGTVTVQIDENSTTTATVTLTQAAVTLTTSVSYALTVNPQSLSFVNTGENKSFAVTAQKITKTYVNGVLTNTATANVAWSSSVVGAGFFVNNNVVTAANNTTTSQRNGTVTVKINEYPTTTATVSLTQAAAIVTYQYVYELAVNKTRLVFPAIGQQQQVNATTRRITKKYINGVYQSGQDVVQTGLPLTNTRIINSTAFTDQISGGTTVLVTAAENRTASRRYGLLEVTFYDKVVYVDLEQDPVVIATVNTNYKLRLSIGTSGFTYFDKVRTRSFSVLEASKVIQTFVNGQHDPSQDVYVNNLPVTAVVTTSPPPSQVGGFYLHPPTTGTVGTFFSVTAPFWYSDEWSDHLYGECTVSIDEHPSTKSSLHLTAIGFGSPNPGPDPEP